MNSLCSKAVVLLGMGLVASSVGHAETTAPAPVAVPISAAGGGESFFDSVSKSTALNYLGIYRGASLSNLGSSYQPNVDGTPDTSSAQSVENYITTGYKATPDLMMGVTWRFFYYPVGEKGAGSQDLHMWDPNINITKTNLYKNGNFSLTGKLWVTLPVSKYDTLQKEKAAVAVSPILVASYDVPHTNLNLGVFTYVRGYVPTADSGPNVLSYKIYIAPNATYQLSKTVAATLWVDLVQVKRRAGTGFISGMENAEIDIEPGINWDITKNISFNPLINIYPSHPTLASTSLQANIIARAF